MADIGASILRNSKTSQRRQCALSAVPAALLSGRVPSAPVKVKIRGQFHPQGRFHIHTHELSKPSHGGRGFSYAPYERRSGAHGRRDRGDHLNTYRQQRFGRYGGKADAADFTMHTDTRASAPRLSVVSERASSLMWMWASVR